MTEVCLDYLIRYVISLSEEHNLNDEIKFMETGGILCEFSQIVKTVCIEYLTSVDAREMDFIIKVYAIGMTEAQNLRSRT